MADAILSFVLESIGKLLNEEATFLQGVTDQVKQLHDDLERIKRFLNYADTKQSARAWISEFKAIACEANDLVEDYVFRVASQNKEGVTNTVKRYACIFSECHARHNLGKEIQSLRNRISDLTKDFGNYGAIIGGEGSSSMDQKLSRTYSFFSKSEEDFVGTESDVSLLVKYLVNEDGFGHKSVVSIYDKSLDAGASNKAMNKKIEDGEANLERQLKLSGGPISRAKAKRFQNQLQLCIQEVHSQVQRSKPLEELKNRKNQPCNLSQSEEN